MFPWVYGFHWSAGYIIFLGLFFAVAVSVAIWLVAAFLRTRADFASGEGDEVMWESIFHDLPAQVRVCRHELAGEMQRVCPNGFDCRSCETHAGLLPHGVASAGTPGKPGEAEEVAGLTFPLDRYYHRGHTWAQPAGDGSVKIGLDELGKRFAPGIAELPPVGSHLEVNGTGWYYGSGRIEGRILSPVKGIVVAHGNAGDDWVLRVKPSGRFNATHLLRGSEVRPWVVSELGRLGRSAGVPALGATLPDGGVLVEDPVTALGAAAVPAREELF